MVKLIETSIVVRLPYWHDSLTLVLKSTIRYIQQYHFTNCIYYIFHLLSSMYCPCLFPLNVLLEWTMFLNMCPCLVLIHSISFVL